MQNVNADQEGRRKPENTIEKPEFDRANTLSQFHSATWELQDGNRSAWFPTDVAMSMRVMLGASGEFRKEKITQDIVTAPIAGGARLRRCDRNGKQNTTPVIMSDRDYLSLKAYCEETGVATLSLQDRAAEDSRDRFR